jgi:ABC-type Fe3+ transport system permease subunit
MTVTNIYLIDPADMTYTEQFYMNYSLASDATRASLSVLPALLGLALLIAGTFWLLAKLASRKLLAGAGRAVCFPRSRSTYPLTAVLWTCVVVLVGLPLASLVAKAGFVVVQEGDQRRRGWSALKALEVIVRAPQDFGYEFGWTAAIAVAAATLAVVLAVALAWPARRGGRGVLPMLAVCALCLVVPGPLVGVALIGLFNRPSLPPLVWLYDETLVPSILATTVRTLPLAVLLVWHSLATLRDDELAAAALDRAGTWRTLWQIVLPQRRLAIAGAWLAAFAIAAGDLAWSLLVLPPGVDTIARRLFGLVHAGVEEQVAGICLIVVLVYGVLAAAVLSLLRLQPSRAPEL